MAKYPGKRRCTTDAIAHVWGNAEGRWREISGAPTCWPPKTIDFLMQIMDELILLRLAETEGERRSPKRRRR